MFEGINSSPLSRPSPISSSTSSKANMKDTYWALGDKFWMQIIDGKYHEYGPMVFDEAKHSGPKEPGFFASLQEGCRFASEHLGEKPNLHFYKDLHRVLCAHFKGEETQTVMGAEALGLFRKDSARIRPSIREFSKDAKEHYTNLYFHESEDLLNLLKESEPARYEKICADYPAAKKWVNDWEKLWQKKAREVNDYVSKICDDAHIPRFVTIFKSDDYFYVDYTALKPEEHEKIAEFLFNQYNDKIAECNAKLMKAASSEEIARIKEEKLEAIAHFYQMLEWQHPFPDGQGRTDLVLLSKLLTEEGFNPAILEDPYFSSWSTLEEWKPYLADGIKAWQEARASS